MAEATTTENWWQQHPLTIDTDRWRVKPETCHKENAGHVWGERELYLLDKLLINIEDSRSMCDHKKKYTWCTQGL